MYKYHTDNETYETNITIFIIHLRNVKAVGENEMLKNICFHIATSN